jgi:hypothetical protein
MNVYLVEISGGEYDGSWNQIYGAYSTKEKAEEAILISQIKREELLKTLEELERQAREYKAQRTEHFRNKLSAARHAKEEVYYTILEFEINGSIKDYE